MGDPPPPQPYKFSPSATVPPSNKKLLRKQRQQGYGKADIESQIALGNAQIEEQANDKQMRGCMRWCHKQIVYLLIAYLVIAMMILGVSVYLKRIAPYENTELRFLLVGDWGMPGQPQRMEFIVSVGDNAYNFGVNDVNDPLFITAFEEVYSYPLLRLLPWWHSIGNHDARGNVSAQVLYSKRSWRWNLPSDYYSMQKRFKDTEVNFIFLNTNILVCPDFDTVDFHHFLKTRECEIFHRGRPLNADDSSMEETWAAIAKKNNIARRAQLVWLEETLQNIANAERDKATQVWTIVVGHHSMYSASLSHGDNPILVYTLLPILKKHVDVYFSGHDHTLQHLRTGSRSLEKRCLVDHIVTGGGGYRGPVHQTDSEGWATKNAEVQGRALYAQAMWGFMPVVISSGKGQAQQLHIDFIDNNGTLTYQTTIHRCKKYYEIKT